MKRPRLAMASALALLHSEIQTSSVQRRTDWNPDNLIGSSPIKELTEHDNAMLRRAEEKRARKAAKRVPK